jgi:hypothetical protein
VCGTYINGFSKAAGSFKVKLVKSIQPQHLLEVLYASTGGTQKLFCDGTSGCLNLLNQEDLGMRTSEAFRKNVIISKSFLEAILKQLYKYPWNFTVIKCLNHKQPDKRYRTNFTGSKIQFTLVRLYS